MDSQSFQPFLHVSWSRDKAAAASVIWEWRSHIVQIAGQGNGPASYEEDAYRIEQGMEPIQMPQELVLRIRDVSQRYSLPIDWFARPLRVLHRMQGPLRLTDSVALKAFVADWAAPHANLLAKLADCADSWHLKPIGELAAGFFLVDRLMRLPRDLERDLLFIPESDLEQAGVRVSDLKEGDMSPAVRKLLWKQAIRIRDAFAQGQPLVRDLERRYRRAFKYNWLTGLEYVNEIERRKYDLWSAPIELSRPHRIQVWMLSWIGKGASQARSR